MNDSIQILLEVVDKATPELQKFQASLSSVGQSVRGFASTVASVGAAAGVALAAGLATMVKNAINAADEMGKTAQKIGISVESLSALNYAAGLSDVSMEQLKTGFNALNKSIIEANDPTTAAAAAFKYLGVEVKNADGSYRKADDVFKDIAASMAKLPDGTSKSAVAMEIFGKAGADLIPMLNSGREGLEELRLEAENLGLIMSTETTKQAEAFNDSLTRVGNAASGVGLGIAKEVLPTLNTLASEMINAVKEGEGFKNFAKGVGEVFKWVVKAGAGVVFTFNTIGKGIGALAAVASRVIVGDFAGAKQIISDYGDETKAAALSTAEFMEKIDAGVPSIEHDTKAVTAATAAKIEYAGKTKTVKAGKDEETKSFEKAYAALLKESEGYSQLTAVQKVEYNIAQKVAGFRDAEHQAEMRRIAAQVDAKRRAIALSQGEADQNLLMVKTIDQMTTEQNNLLASQQALFENGSRRQALDERARAAYAAITDEIKNLGFEIAELQKNPIDNALQIENAQARMDGLNKSLKGGIAGFTEEWTKSALAIEGITHNMTTFKTYIGDARDRMKEFAAQAEDLNISLQAGLITQEQFNLAMERLNTAKFAEMRSQVTELQKTTADFASGIENTFGNVFYNIMQGNFKDIETMFKQMLDRMVAEALAANLARALFGDFQKSGQVSGQAGGLLTSLVGSLFNFRAEGGPVTAGQPYIVGEKRPELFVPRTSGTILPDTSALAMAGGNNVQFSITAMDSQDVIRALDKIKRPLADMVNSTGRAYNMK